MQNVLPSCCLVIITTMLMVGTGCSGTKNCVIPETRLDDALELEVSLIMDSQSLNGRNIWGMWLIGVDPDLNEAEIVPLRSPQTHWNVLNWLENGPCTNCLQITSFANSNHDTKLIDIKITHPFSNANFTGFDVRGIAMFNGSHTFPISGLNIPDRTMGDGELLDADGFTTLYNFTTFGQGTDGLQGYLKGKFSTLAPPTARLNGFMRYVSSDAGNTRDAFYSGDSITRTFDIDMPDSPFVMGYAVDASWVPPTVKPVTDPMNDFPPEANCLEPYGIEVTETDGGLTEFGGEIDIAISVFDHQGNDTHADPVLECPELFDTPQSVYGFYHTYIHNDKGAPPGEYQVLVSVEDEENASSAPWIDLTAYTTFTVTVEGETGWARTWGGDDWDISRSVTIDDDENIYVGGYFAGTVDFDPGSGEDIHASNNNTVDAFVSKFDASGNHIWTVTWGGTGRDTVEQILIPPFYDSIYIVGSFEGTVDFDPGSGISEKTSNGESDAFYSLITTDAIYQYSKTWGGLGDDAATCVAHDGYYHGFAGTFEGTAGFPYGSNQSSNGGKDVFMFFGDGVDFELVTFGGTENETATDMIYKSGTVILCGSFQNSVDFGDYNPDIRTSLGSTDAYLTCYTQSGSYLWTRAWGSTLADSASALTAVGDNITVTGSFRETVNFNGEPGGSSDNISSNGFTDAFISRYQYYSGDYVSTVTFGSDGWDLGLGIGAGKDGTTICAGNISNTVLGHVSNGSYDAILVEYDSDMTVTASFSWGGTGSDSCSDLLVDPYGRMFVTGGFDDTVDFDPGDTVENHTSNGGVADGYLMKLFPGFVWE